MWTPNWSQSDWIGKAASRPEPTCDYRACPIGISGKLLLTVTNRSPPTPRDTNPWVSSPNPQPPTPNPQASSLNPSFHHHLVPRRLRSDHAFRPRPGMRFLERLALRPRDEIFLRRPLRHRQILIRLVVAMASRLLQQTKLDKPRQRFDPAGLRESLLQLAALTARHPNPIDRNKHTCIYRLSNPHG